MFEDENDSCDLDIASKKIPILLLEDHFTLRHLICKCRNTKILVKCSDIINKADIKERKLVDDILFVGMAFKVHNLQVAKVSS